MTMEPYRYDEAWKAQVDHAGEEWRAYCEGVALLKRYFQTRAAQGRYRAKLEFEASLSKKEEKLGARGKELAGRLRADFLLIGEHEGDRIEREVLGLPEAA